ncbi:unnamed protein product, partial [Vitis vinifera]|uniref:Uncharacterized protein n=1 Tax=Vitis vinifera TaxID=29760 RepID=D7TVA5_VITVI
MNVFFDLMEGCNQLQFSSLDLLCLNVENEHKVGWVCECVRVKKGKTQDSSHCLCLGMTMFLFPCLLTIPGSFPIHKYH